ncbi:hypothetical protein ES703_22186 [subsurface metagenome]
MVLVDAARTGVVLFAQRCSHPNDLAHHAASPHHADRTKRHVGDADAPPCHHQVLDVPRVEAAVGYRIRVYASEFGNRAEFLAWEVSGVFGVRVV